MRGHPAVVVQRVPGLQRQSPVQGLRPAAHKFGLFARISPRRHRRDVQLCESRLQMVSREDYGLRRLHGHRRSGDCGHPSGQGAQPGEPPASCPVSAGCQASGIRRRLAGDGDGPASVQDSQGVAREFGAASFVHSLDRARACMHGRAALAFRQEDPVPAAPGSSVWRRCWPEYMPPAG